MDKEKRLNLIFYISLAVKAIDGVVEVLAGAIVWLWGVAALQSLAVMLTRHELLEDKNDLLANLILKIASGVSVDAKYFLIIFFLSHGIAKIILAALLFKNKIWAYPLAIILFGAAVVNQIFRLVAVFSWLVFVITLIDIFVIIVVWKKYNDVKKLRHENNFGE